MISRFQFLRSLFCLFLTSTLSALIFHDKWSTEAKLTETPNDVAAPLSTRVTLSCGTDILHIPIDWYFDAKDKTSGTPRQIYLNGVVTFAVNSTYSVDVGPNGTYVLVIKSLDWKDAGTYVCHDRASAGEEASVSVTVFDPIPVGEIRFMKSIESLVLCNTIVFRFRYFGDTVPKLRWNTENQFHPSRSNSSISTTSSTGPVPSNISYQNITMDTCHQHNCTDCAMFCNFGNAASDSVEQEEVAHEILLDSNTVVFVIRCKRNRHDSVTAGDDQDFHFTLSLRSFAVAVTAVALLLVAVVGLGCCLFRYRIALQDLKRNRFDRKFPLRYEFLRLQEEAESTDRQGPRSSTPGSGPEASGRGRQEHDYTDLCLNTPGPSSKQHPHRM